MAKNTPKKGQKTVQIDEDFDEFDKELDEMLEDDFENETEFDDNLVEDAYDFPDEELSEDDSPDDIEVTEEDEDTASQEADEAPEAKADEPVVEDPAPAKKASRSEKRIRELANERKQLIQALGQQEYNNLYMTDKALEDRLNMADQNLKDLDQAIKENIERADKLAEDGDIREAQKYSRKASTQELEKAKLELHQSELKSRRSQVTKAMTDLETKIKAGVYRPDIPGLNLDDAPSNPAEEWDARNPWFAKPSNEDEVRKRTDTYGLYQVLVGEGKDPSTEEFYDELDQRLAKLRKDVVHSNSNTSSKAALGTEKTGEASQTKKPVNVTSVKSVTAGGSSRSASGTRLGGAAQGKKLAVSLTAGERQTAALLGVSPMEYAQEKLRIQRREQSLKRQK